MAICLQTTNLDCDHIPVEVTKINHGVQGQAILYRSGNMKIQINSVHINRGMTEIQLKTVLTHEFAHLVTYSQGETKSIHGKQFRKNCLAMSDITGTSHVKTCSSHANH